MGFEEFRTEKKIEKARKNVENMPEDKSSIISSRLRQAMEYFGVSQTELSKRTGIPKASISQYLSGYSQPKTDRIYLICRALNIREAWLMGFEVAMLNRKDIITDEELFIIEEYREADYTTKDIVKRILSHAHNTKKEE